jgi:hypothetical protein
MSEADAQDAPRLRWNDWWRRRRVKDVCRRTESLSEKARPRRRSAERPRRDGLTGKATPAKLLRVYLVI